METLPRSMYMTTIWRRTASSGSAPAMIMPTIAPGRKIMPVVFVASMRGMRARWRAVSRMGDTAWRLVAPRARAASALRLCSVPSSRVWGLAAGRPEGEGGLDLEALFRHVVADAGHRQARGVHGVPYYHAAERDQVP